MKIAFLVTGLDAPSARYRVLQYLPFLEKEGCISEVYMIPKKYWERIKLFREMKNYDIVFLQKRLLNPVWGHILRKNSRRLIYDFDDAVMFRDSNKKNYSSGKRKNNFLRIVKNSDIIIAGNEYLKAFAVKENPNTFIIPTSIDMDRYIERPSVVSSESVVLGWIGSSSTLSYLEKMKNVWDALYDRFSNVRLKIVADKFFDCDRIPVIKKQWRYEEEIDDLHSFDIGLMPLTDDPWSRGKCGFKLLQYMAVGIPAVCSPVGVNRTIVTDGVNGFWANDDAEWIEKIGALISNDKLRLQMGKIARETVLKRYSVDIAIKQLLKLLNTLRKR
jgi:glycosyltransferase involved in cell wall biosynthesis